MSTGGTSRDVVLATLLVTAAFAVLSVIVGLQPATGKDTDQALHERTLDSMRAGEGYYDAMADSLREKEGSPPANVWTVRPPGQFLIMHLLPTRWWRYLVGVAFAATALGAAWLAAEGAPTWSPPVAAGLVGVWAVHFTRYLYLHHEVWGTAIAVVAVAALRRRPALAAGLLAGAAVLREMYLPVLVVAAIVDLARGGRRRPWLIASGVAVGSLLVHVVLATRILDEHGADAPYLGVTGDVRWMLESVSPGTTPLAYALGVGVLVLGLIGAVHRRREDVAAMVVCVVVPLFVLGTWWSGRAYWKALWVPFVCGFAGAGVAALARWRRDAVAAT